MPRFFAFSKIMVTSGKAHVRDVRSYVFVLTARSESEVCGGGKGSGEGGRL